MGWHDADSSKIDRRRWARLRREVLDRDSWKCVQCGRRGRLEVDHVIPMRWGGAVYELSNLQTLCRAPCHFEKSAAETRKDNKDSEPAGAADWRALIAERMDTRL